MNDIAVMLKQVGARILECHTKSLNGVKEFDMTILSSIQCETELINAELQRIDNAVVAKIGLCEPGSDELRYMIALLKITSDLERIANAARKYIRDVGKYLKDGFNQSFTYNHMILLHQSTITAIELALEACNGDENAFDYDACLKHAIIEESKTDDLFSLIHKEIIFSDYSDEVYLRLTIELFNSVRRLERAADHSVNIIKLMIFARKGGSI